MVAATAKSRSYGDLRPWLPCLRPPWSLRLCDTISVPLSGGCSVLTLFVYSRRPKRVRRLDISKKRPSRVGDEFLGEEFWRRIFGGKMFGREFLGTNFRGRIFGEEFCGDNFWGVSEKNYVGRMFVEHFLKFSLGGGGTSGRIISAH